MHRGAGLRAQANRFIVLVALVALLPLVAVVERLAKGYGRRLALRGISAIARVCGVRFEVRISARGPLPSPAIFTPNHSSPMDIPAMLVAQPALRFLAASDLFRIPLLATAMRALDTVPIDRHHPDIAHRQLDELIDNGDHDDDFVIFPEGGIAPTPQGLPFKTGAFALAIQTATPIIPVAIHGARDVLPGRRFLAVRPGAVVVELLEPVYPTGLSLEDRGALRDRVQAAVSAALASGRTAGSPGPGHRGPAGPRLGDPSEVDLSDGTAQVAPSVGRT